MTQKPHIKPGTPGTARVEYYACREEVESLLAQGYTARAIYEFLKGQDRYTCSYSAFCDYIRGQGERKHSKNKPKALPTLPAPSQAQQGGSRIIKQKASRFVPPSEYKLEDVM